MERRACRPASPNGEEEGCVSLSLLLGPSRGLKGKLRREESEKDANDLSKGLEVRDSQTLRPDDGVMKGASQILRPTKGHEGVFH